MPIQKELVINSLQAHVDFMESARVRHQIWKDRTIDPEIARGHLETIELFLEAIDQCNDLLVKYQKSIE